MPEHNAACSVSTRDVLVVGIGYTGSRILGGLPRDFALGLSRTDVRTNRNVALLDLDSASELPVALPQSYDIVYTVPPARTAPADVRLQKLLDLLERPPGRFVYISTTGVYGNRGGAIVDERTTPSPQSSRARRRMDAERRLTDWCRRNSTELVILRVPGIYGPGRLGIDRIRDGTPVLAEADANPGNRIHVDDLATCAVRALSRNAPSGIFNVGDGDERSSTWFTLEVARQCGLPAPPMVSRRKAERLFSPKRLSFLAESRRVDTSKMRNVLGFTPRYANSEDGIRASLADEST